MFSKDIISQSIIDAVSNVLNLDEKIDTKKRTTDTLTGRVKIPATAGDNEHTDYKVELNAEETDKGESSTDAKGNKTTKYKDGSWQTETPTHKDDGKNPEGKVHHLSDVARRKMIKMNANNEEVELDEVLDTRKSIKSYLDKNDAQRTTLKASGTFDKVKKRLTGANKALDKLSKLNREEVELDEKLNIQNTSMGDIIKDFQTSDAPQFAGKSQAKRRQMAIAAKMATEEYLDEENAIDKVTMDVPLLIRIMEYSKEDAKSDMDLHKVAENLVEYSKSGKTLTMSCYNEIVGGITEAKRPEDDSVPFITNEDDLAGHVDKIKKTVKHHFKKLKANEEVELEESGQTERKKSFVDMLDRISAKAKENTKLQQNRKIDPKLPKK